MKLDTLGLIPINCMLDNPSCAVTLTRQLIRLLFVRLGCLKDITETIFLFQFTVLVQIFSQ